MTGELEVRFEDGLVGLITADPEFRLTYAAEWLARATAFPISVSLPLRSEPWGGPVAAAWFGNLLPEGAARQAVCGRLGISDDNDLALLRAIGGECAGALTIIDPRASPSLTTDGAKPEELDGRALSAVVASGAAPLLIGGPGLRLSLAGAQNKLPVTLVDGRVCLPSAGAASTHLLKLPHPRFAHLPINEAFVMGLAAHIGLDVAHVQVFTGTTPPSLLVERYDRVVAAPNAGVRRLHQEDFCQATGRSAGRKYEQEGGPSLAEGVSLVARHTTRPLPDVRRLLEWQAFNLIVGNCDGHGKNLSLLREGGGLRLAPFYDLLSTRQYRVLDRNLAMSVGGRRDPDVVHRAQWQALARDASFAERFVLDLVGATVHRVMDGLSAWTEAFSATNGRQAIIPTLPRWIAKNAMAAGRRAQG